MANLSKIDVVIPLFNAADYIGHAINSALRQTLQPRLIIVVDDCSTDNSASIVRSFIKKNPNILYFKTDKNSGPSKARNIGIKNSTASYIAFLDADDLWAPTKLFKQYEVFTKSSFGNDLALVYSNCEDLDASGSIIANGGAFELKRNLKGDVFSQLKNGNLISGSASGALIKRTCIDNVGFFDETLEACEDWDLWLRISKKYKVDYVNEKLVYIRRHLANSQWDSSRMLSGYLKFHSKLYISKNLTFRRAMSLRANIFRYSFTINNIYELFRLAIKPNQTRNVIKRNLERNSGWRSEQCNSKFKKYLISLYFFTPLLAYLLLHSFIYTLKAKFKKKVLS
jgi:glycosyltransferase involved in cell wall biosynthesis